MTDESIRRMRAVNDETDPVLKRFLAWRYDPARLLPLDDIDDLVFGPEGWSWWRRTHPEMSEHLVLEVSAVRSRGRPLSPGEPVPGCGCETCTGIPVPPAPPRTRESEVRSSADVDAARAVNIAVAADQLGIEPIGATWRLCPFHRDRSPSLHINQQKQRAFCNVCGLGLDSIGLVRKVRGIAFIEAVRWLAE